VGRFEWAVIVMVGSSSLRALTYPSPRRRRLGCRGGGVLGWRVRSWVGG
jgi:hypothetical protein